LKSNRQNGNFSEDSSEEYVILFLKRLVRSVPDDSALWLLFNPRIAGANVSYD